MANSVNIKVKRTGRVRGPNLADPQLKAIGEKIVAAQKERWDKAVDANGQPAKKLAVRYAIIKQMLLHKRPVRDMKLTGKTYANFQLRKAADGVIRAENTTKLERDKARRANSYDQMIGFAVSDAKVLFDETQAQYGQYVQRAWIPLDRAGSGLSQQSMTSQSTYAVGPAANTIFVGSGGKTRRPPAMRK